MALDNAARMPRKTQCGDHASAYNKVAPVPGRKLSAINKEKVDIWKVINPEHIAIGSFIIAGHPGSGKTTLLLQIQQTWQLLARVQIWWWWLDLSQSEHRRIDSLENVAKLNGCPSLREIQRNKGRHTVLVIDNLNFQPSSFIASLLSKSILKDCTIIVATEYSNMASVTAHMSDYDIFDMIGLNEEDVPEIMLQIGRQRTIRSSVDRMIDYIRSDHHLLDMCRNPAIISTVWEVFKENGCRCPKTKTSFMKDIVKYVLSKAEQQSEIDEFLDCVCYLAFSQIMKTREDDYNQHDFSCLCMQGEVRISGVAPKFGLGLMQLMTINGRISCKFLHRTVQSYLAALHIHKRPIFDQAYISLWLSRCYSEYEMMLIFYFGIAHTRLPQSSSLNEEKIILHPILDTMSDKILEENSELNIVLIFFLSCIYEAQEPSLARKFLSRKQHSLAILLDENMRGESKLQMLSYCMANSGITKWTIEAPYDKLYLTEYLKMLVTDLLSSEVKSHFELQVKEALTFKLSAISTGASAHTPAKSKPRVYFRILRELLHRLLQLYSPIKLKSDGSNSSYVSILACECLQREMENNHILCLEPITASHWLPLKSKGKKEPNYLDNNPQTMLHMQKHSGEYKEYVVMTTPIVQRIKFIIPGTREKITIELSSSDSPDFFNENSVDQDTTLMQHVYEERHFDASRQKFIPPSMPLPKQTNSSAQTVAPEIPEAPKVEIAQPRDVSSDRVGGVAVPAVDSRSNATNRHEGRTINRSPYYDQIGTFGSAFNASMFEQVAHQAQPHRQTVMKPGVIMHTTISTIFATDQQYPLPDESRLLRKGGNGEIYLGEFSEMELVVKKTSYRNREIQIHRKLRHNNVVQLLALMVGERHPSQRRRLTCYHFLPKMTGDLARLVVDSEENTLKKLRLRYGGNPKQFGLIQGNLKYILIQILQGLVYLHGLNIVHRDLKSSNVLLKFHCQCSNALMCECTKKCDVQIADFDSAVQLSEDGLLPASNVNRSDSHQKTFAVVPVGTNGYRPPESSLFIVSNNVDGISPQVSVKADIWSAGVLMMKMIVGRYGPSTQREVSFYKVC